MSKGPKAWLELLRRVAGAEDPGSQQRLEAEAGLWQAFEAATESGGGVVEVSSQLSIASARQRKLADALAEDARNLVDRGKQVRGGLPRLGEVLERLRLVALNVGLEGTRMSDAGARALGLAADEVRAHVDAGADALRELQTLLDEMWPVSGRVAEASAELRASGAELGDLVARTHTLAQDATKDLARLGTHARALSQTDPDTARQLDRAAEHARGLVTALGALRGAPQLALARAVLRPLLEPIARLLADEEGGPVRED
jgi:hypothetical protein